MAFVWLRIVLRETTSSRAIPGPSRSVASNRSTSSSRPLSGSTRSWLIGDASTPAAERREELANVGRRDPAVLQRLQQGGHRRAFIEEDADVALGFGESQRASERRRARPRHRHASGGRAPAAPGSRWRRPSCPPATAASSRRSRSADAAVSDWPAAVPRRLRQQEPREGDVLERPDVLELVLGRQAFRPHPAARFAQPSLIDPDTCPQRGDGPDPRVEVGDIQALCVVEQGERTGRISLRCARPGHGDAPSIWVLA